jgi:leader peptidase (prepilin peptidase)/N-methyltransferase
MENPATALRALEIAWVLLAGAAVGSFLNVVIARVPHGESVVRPGSRCPRCGTPIAWRDNVPLLSWILLGGRCRSCRAGISVRYPAVEALGAGAALLAWQRHGLGAAAAAEFAFAAALVALAFIDLDTWLLPNALTWPLGVFGLAASALGVSAAPSLPSSIAGAALGFAGFAAVAWVGARVFKKEALGFGDVWLLGALGAWLGAAALLPVVLLASVQGSAVGIVLVLLGRGEPGPGEARGAGTPPAAGSPAAGVSGPEDADAWVPPRHAVPFGPFLVAGALEWLYLSGRIAERVPGLEVFL